MEQEIFVYVELNEVLCFVGRLWARVRKGRESATFEYARSWLQHPNRFALEPALMLIDGPQHTAVNKMIFGALGDSAPDRWGRVLMRRAERQRAQIAESTPRTLMEIDYLLMVHDESRQGALRFCKQKSGPFLSDNKIQIPPLIELPKLLSATERLVADHETAADIQLLLAPGSSLGGARPKASILDRDGCLAIAKFPHKDDEADTVLWEAVALTLAKLAKIHVPDWRLENVAGKSVLISRRFDRIRNKRRPYISAMSMLGANDNDPRSYLEIVDSIIQYGAFIEKDIQQLWRRLIFNILISNTDDHLRNHGFIYIGTEGWQLSPAFDLNPVPIEIKPRILTTTIDLHDGSASLELALSVADYFQLEQMIAKKIIGEIAEVVSTWQIVAKHTGLTKQEINRMESAFEHQELAKALSWR